MYRAPGDATVFGGGTASAVVPDPSAHPPAPRRPADDAARPEVAHSNGHRPDPDEATLADALTRAKAGDEAGFVTLYRAMAPRLHRYATALVGW